MPNTSLYAYSQCCLIVLNVCVQAIKTYFSKKKKKFLPFYGKDINNGYKTFIVGRLHNVVTAYITTGSSILSAYAIGYYIINIRVFPATASSIQNDTPLF